MSNARASAETWKSSGAASLASSTSQTGWCASSCLPQERQSGTTHGLTVDRSCDGATDSAEPTPSSEPTETAVAEPTESATAADAPAEEPSTDPAGITDTTVDELLDRLNSADMGGIEVGDQFRLTGELFMSELWFTGATGDYVVMLKAQGGAQDLSVFVEETEAAEWHDGTVVEMVVENVERTLNGETSDGWLLARSVETIS